MVGLVPFVLWMDGWIDMRYLMLTGRVGPSWSVGTMGPGWNKYHYVGRGPRLCGKHQRSCSAVCLGRGQPFLCFSCFPWVVISPDVVC